MKMGVHWGSLPQGALARTRERRVGFELELWSWTRRGARAGGLVAVSDTLEALLAERGRGQSLEERRHSTPEQISQAADVVAQIKDFYRVDYGCLRF